MAEDARRALPSVERVAAAMGCTTLPRALVVDCARRAVDAARAALDGNGHGNAMPPTHDAVVEHALALAAAGTLELLQPVINATGVLLHTNLGRAPLGDYAITALTAAAGATNLEYRLAEGTRGSRHAHAGSLLALACGAEAGIVVNNNAAAVVLTLAALARDREVVVSRGELVEIGGGFRVPEILAETGARLVEVGTTNRTRRADYERACTDSTALLLKVHASNYRMIGFTETTPVHELASLALPVVVDAGSGLLDVHTPWLDAAPAWLQDEPGVRQCIDEGAALVTFSGDKLLGGPQAGIVVGRREFVDRLAAHPLARALRADKLTLAALQSVALSYLAQDGAAIPLWSMATTPLDVLRARAAAIAGAVEGSAVIDTEAAAGGGSLPGLTIPSLGVALDVGSVTNALRELRVEHRVIARSEAGRIVCDLRSVPPAADAVVADALRAVAAATH
ncbi:MAG TPA: L-seryl-tRNA(Sec) selenium transferase [Acidimicrobiia bacterium]